ncbi:hypothetical protein VSX64_16335 [Aurantimonas sp. C2-6-R+9]|uniref:capsular polysaccharide export protein, LipB/KpsS family n=1 Tax=unclassified Aurantimonas TaxID=2638230 RepID=UPI002E18BDAA|nr:hypothetical protein [Aurantimonas sp. C2-6-R+9]
MRILFATQSDSLRMFEALRAALDARVGVEAAGFTVSDSFAYGKWAVEHPEFERRGHVILREWEVTSKRSGKPNLAGLAAAEERLGGEPGLFGAIVADRRLIMGPDCTYSQDYRRRFTDDELLRILEEGVAAVERLFDEVRPDVVVGFIVVTMLDYLVYLVAKARGVRVLNIRPTRVADRVALSSTLNDPDPDFVVAYERALVEPSPFKEEARAYLTRVREQHGRYEGVVSPSKAPALKINRTRTSPVGTLARVWRNWRTYRSGPARTDNHVPDPLRALAFAALVNPMRARLAARRLGSHFATADRLAGGRYLFFPLHTEPEVSLLVYGRPYVNQIEIIRALAISLPADMVLVAKEHPWMVGKRTRGAYEKMLEIPKVMIAPPEMQARDLIAGASAIAVVTGSVALEAAILGKPVITFGDCPYNVLPDTLVTRCADPRRLPEQIAALLQAEQRDPDDRAREAYLAAVFETSASISLYSKLLAKSSVHVERETDFNAEIGKLTEFVLTCQARDPAALGGSAAAW